MDTVRGISAKLISSPRALGTLIAICFLIMVFTYFVISSNTCFDDLAVALLLLVFLVEFYLQHDWFIIAAEKVLCPPDVLCRIPVRRRLAALTIDDIPCLKNPTKLDELLEVLRKNKVKATLFIMSGFDMEPELGGMESKARARYRELLRQAAAEGHELANHLQFDRPAIAMEPEEFDHAFDHCDALISELSGGSAAWKAKPWRWFRPASALWNKHMLLRARKKGYTTAIASCYPHDVASISRFFNSYYLQSRVRPGAIIIVHDRWHTPMTLATALPAILSTGMELGTLSDLHAAHDAEALGHKHD
eukprot:TRINITY_DN50745_c0_g1_i1.p1 TRINITY_DN50745_c0_g1~~TRINITY_DN50745_c0_g1_i1.p1  ORF type:complete len:306 (+),score=46.93 TRINITY_DN50745_c0_g1_i1:74-991(+)